MKWPLFGLLAAALCPGGPDAMAATSSATLAVSASVNATATTSIPPTVHAKNLDPTQPSETTTQLQVTCPAGVVFDVGMGSGANAIDGQRYLLSTDGSNRIAYDLYSDAAYSHPWGSTPGTDTAEAVGTGSPQPITVYLKIAPFGAAGAGVYADTITVTVTY